MSPDITAMLPLGGIVLFFGTWPPFNTVAAPTVNRAVTAAPLALRRPPPDVFVT